MVFRGLDSYATSDNLKSFFMDNYWKGITAREMQLVFRHRGGSSGKVFMSAAAAVVPLGRAPTQAPSYWSLEAKEGCVGQKLIPGSLQELVWMQEILDNTFKNKVTRDRKDGQALADRLCGSADACEVSIRDFGNRLCGTSQGRVEGLFRNEFDSSKDNDGISWVGTAMHPCYTRQSCKSSYICFMEPIQHLL